MDNTINEVSRLCTSTVLSGTFFSKQDLRLDGAFTGSICTSGRVVIGEGAYVEGDIICNTLDIWGEVHGNLFVKDALSLKASAVVEGDMRFDRFQVEIGATFSGSCSRIVESEYEAKFSSSSPEDPRVKTKTTEETVE